MPAALAVPANRTTTNSCVGNLIQRSLIKAIVGKLLWKVSQGKNPPDTSSACLRCIDSSELLSDGRLDPHVTQTELPRLAICCTAWDDACDRHSLTPCVCHKPRPMPRPMLTCFQNTLIKPADVPPKYTNTTS
jgi:hypothetical protein